MNKVLRERQSYRTAKMMFCVSIWLIEKDIVSYLERISHQERYKHVEGGSPNKTHLRKNATIQSTGYASWTTTFNGGVSCFKRLHLWWLSPRWDFPYGISLGAFFVFGDVSREQFHPCLLWQWRFLDFSNKPLDAKETDGDAHWRGRNKIRDNREVVCIGNVQYGEVDQRGRCQSSVLFSRCLL